MSLQVVGNVEPGAKVVLWSETRTPIQMWNAKLSGPISSLTFPGLLLDVKGKMETGCGHLTASSKVGEAEPHQLEVE